MLTFAISMLPEHEHPQVISSLLGLNSKFLFQIEESPEPLPYKTQNYRAGVALSALSTCNMRAQHLRALMLPHTTHCMDAIVINSHHSPQIFEYMDTLQVFLICSEGYIPNRIGC